MARTMDLLETVVTSEWRIQLQNKLYLECVIGEYYVTNYIIQSHSVQVREHFKDFLTNLIKKD